MIISENSQKQITTSARSEGFLGIKFGGAFGWLAGPGRHSFLVLVIKVICTVSVTVIVSFRQLLKEAAHP